MERRNFSMRGRPPAKVPYRYTECGLDNIYLLNGFELEKDDDGVEYVSIENVDDLWKMIGLTLVCSKKTFEPKEIRFVRGLMKKTQAELAALLRVDDQTIARWEKGQCTMPGPADLALRVTFLGSKAAQPEGSKVLTEWMKFLNELIGQDAPNCESFIFGRHNRAWSGEPLHAYA